MKSAACDCDSRLPPLRKPNLISYDISIQVFRKVAKRFGEFCPIKNELRVRKGRKVYRFTCGEGVFRFAAPGLEEVVFPFTPDATALEFRRSIASLLESR